MRNKKWLLLLAVLSTCVISHGQERYLPDAPSHHKFWDRSNTALFTIHAAMEATDFGLTHQNMSNGGQELNPDANRFCETATAGKVVFFAAIIAGVLGFIYFFHKKEHYNWQLGITSL